jgi:ABC-type Fe3+ transport system permease subunit
MNGQSHFIVTLIIIIILIIIGIVLWQRGASQKSYAEQEGGTLVKTPGDIWKTVYDNAIVIMVAGIVATIVGVIGLINIALHWYRDGGMDMMMGSKSYSTRRYRRHY